MIQKEKIQAGRIDDEFVRQTITGKIDDILLYKTPVELTNIMSNIGDGHKFVLIEGAPGSGKSTLALHICQEWAEGTLFQEFDIAILVRLRDPLIRDAKIVADLLPCTNSAMANDQETVIMSLYGKGALWVLDGWDELPSDLSPDSIINKLIRPGVSRESPLHESTVIITSRTSASAALHPLVSSRVEVLGFTPRQLEQYFTECLNGDSQTVQTLLDRIRENPVVEGSCYLPLNASIVVNCFLTDNHCLPTSNHGIFISVVQSSLKRYLQDRLGKTTSVVNITSPDSLPSELRTIFVQMCRLAYYGINENKSTFTDEDLANFSIPKDISDIGLVQTVSSIIGDGHMVYYSFLHLSIQELLAAIYISLKSPKGQISLFQHLFDKARFSVVFQFYAGITKLRTARSFLSKLPRSLCPVPASIFDLVRTVVKRKRESSESKPLLLYLIHCLYEAEDLSLCASVANLLNHKLDLSDTTMNSIDCLSVGYFASVCTNSSNSFSVDLSNCSIGDQGYKSLAQRISKCPSSHSNKLSIDLSSNNINEDKMHSITKLIETCTLLSKLTLTGNAIGKSGLSTLCEALSTNTSLTHLFLDRCLLYLNDHGAIPRLLRANTTLQYLNLSGNFVSNVELNNLCEALSTNTSLHTLELSYCSLTISNDGGTALYQLLSENNSLAHLYLSHNTVTSCHHIAAGLAVNKTLRALNLADCKLTDRSIEELSTGLINNIERLHISDSGDYSITEDGMKMLARHLTIHCPKMNTLLIPDHLLSCTRKMFRKMNKKRRRNRLTNIEVDT